METCKREFNSSGRELDKLLFKSKKFILNGPFKTTHIKGGTLDLILSSFDLAASIGDVIVGDHYDSDHLAISTSIACTPPPSNELRFDFTRGRWHLFQSLINGELDKIEVPNVATPALVDELAISAARILMSAAKVAIPTVTANRVRSWRTNSQIANAIKERHNFQRLHTSTGLPVFRFLANKAKDKFKQLVTLAKQKAINDKLAAIENSRKGKTRKFFHLIDEIAGNNKTTRKGVSSLLVNGKKITSDECKAEVLKNHLADQFRPRNVHSDDPGIKTEQAKIEHHIANNQATFTHLSNAPSVGSLRLHKLDVKTAISSLKIKAPGADGVSNMMLKKGGNKLANFLRKIFNMSLSLGYFPKCWKTAVVSPLPRPGKDLSTAGGYRPISLLPVIGKLLETLIARRLASSLVKSVIPACQSAFRKGHSTTDQIFKLSQVAAMARNNREVLMAAFIDFEGAFNAVWHDGLRFKLNTCNVINAETTRWISSFLRDREFRVKIGSQLSAPAHIEAGVPQGSALSPILFTLKSSSA